MEETDGPETYRRLPLKSHGGQFGAPPINLYMFGFMNPVKSPS
jgi:hypothetical protein